MKENIVMSSLVLLVAVLLVLVLVLVVALLIDLAHRYPKAATPMLIGLGGMTVIVAVVVPIVVRRHPIPCSHTKVSALAEQVVTTLKSWRLLDGQFAYWPHLARSFLATSVGIEHRGIHAFRCPLAHCRHRYCRRGSAARRLLLNPGRGVGGLVVFGG
ncbi:hypothetical protein ACG93S_34670 [Streptomyces sp. WAC01490]|uniref:hypothetical protein n=1 Tax=Streptomyces sp. WAC01490 TaxID=3373093 RepID=UPI003F3BAEDB